MGGVGALQDALVFALASVIAVVITCFGISAVTRAAGDEHDGRTETVLATATSRASLLLAVAAAVAGREHVAAARSPARPRPSVAGTASTAIGAALAQAPAVWVVLGVALLLLSVAQPVGDRRLGGARGLRDLGQVGASLELPGWLIGVSPFHHVPKYPSEAFTWTPEVGDGPARHAARRRGGSPLPQP